MIGCDGHKLWKISVSQIFPPISSQDTTNSAQFEHGGGCPLVQVTHDAGVTLSNEEYFLREVSLCREIFTVVWRHWITLVAWFRCWVWVECQPSFLHFWGGCELPVDRAESN